ncbi:Dabb family protein [Embleya sp. NPDC020886]|uniref:Dabb family protein n=1 Tax=Embleya sp. NPDC020886 TaxID=3363980 RepID=UPI00378E1713
MSGIDGHGTALFETDHRENETRKTMLMHVVIATWKPDVSASDIAGIRTAVERFAEEIPGIRDVRAGADLGLREDNADFAMTAVFADVDALDRFVEHPAHVRVSARPAPLVASVHRIQFPLAGAEPVG